MNYWLSDSHAHYDDEAFDTDRDELLSSMAEKRVKYIINAAQNTESSKKCIVLAEKYDFIYATVGIHPLDAEEYSEEKIAELEKLSAHPKVVAIGETGLDYHYRKDSAEIQKLNFKANIELAKKTNLPIVIHDREAHGDVMNIMKEYEGKVRAVFHCYSGSAETAAELVKAGYMFSFGGSITFKNAVKPAEAVRVIPMDRIMLETDSPYLTPVPFRGTRNHSGMTEYVAEKIAAVKGLYKEEVCEIALENMKKFYGI